MLKATVIYIPGTGGSFLTRVLALSDRCICGTNGCNLQEYAVPVPAAEKFIKYNNWVDADWKSAENSYRLGYKLGLVDFYHYEQSDLWLIDSWHPVEFTTIQDNKSLWGDQNYEFKVFIDVDEQAREFLITNQNSKAYALDWPGEIAAMHKLQQQYKDHSIGIKFADMLDENSFLNSVSKINDLLELELNFDLVQQMWSKWFEASNKIWIK